MAKMKFTELALQFDHIGKLVHAHDVGFTYVGISSEKRDLTLNLLLNSIIRLWVDNQVLIRVSHRRLYPK
jgi:hypothetical protein